MFSDPLQLSLFPKFITADIVRTDDFPATERAADHSTYRVANYNGSGEDLVLFIGHQYGKRERMTMRFTLSKVIADPLVANISVKASNSYYFVCDRSPLFASAEETDVLQLLATALMGVDSNPPVVARILGGET